MMEWKYDKLVSTLVLPVEKWKYTLLSQKRPCCLAQETGINLVTERKSKIRPYFQISSFAQAESKAPKHPQRVSFVARLVDQAQKQSTHGAE